MACPSCTPWLHTTDLDALCRRCATTRKPLFCAMCCCTVADASTISQMKPTSVALQGKQVISVALQGKLALSVAHLLKRRFSVALQGV